MNYFKGEDFKNEKKWKIACVGVIGVIFDFWGITNPATILAAEGQSEEHIFGFTQGDLIYSGGGASKSLSNS